MKKGDFVKVHYHYVQPEIYVIKSFATEKLGEHRLKYALCENIESGEVKSIDIEELCRLESYDTSFYSEKNPEIQYETIYGISKENAVNDFIKARLKTGEFPIIVHLFQEKVE
ncbi:hypothetical protein HBP98_00945 [Listeria booriae]|uniref:Uncharacterized protein n=1 Tax=Listeria booriae TaxID=1552123 RepID=A0A7X1A3I7_9LIST|nr:hypothetical protein [Listeria booriae]MBC2370560.1 hypothetical protein [Listeria booriae]